MGVPALRERTKGTEEQCDGWPHLTTMAIVIEFWIDSVPFRHQGHLFNSLMNSNQFLSYNLLGQRYNGIH